MAIEGLHSLRLRFRRRFRSRQRQVVRMSLEAEEQIEERFFKRLNRLSRVRRFIALWVLLLVGLLAGVMAQLQALTGYYQTLQYVSGGTYSEGVIGSYTNANPLYATGSADAAVSRLVFAGLLKYDNAGNLSGDLAQSWTANERGTVYTVVLRPGLTWQDGAALTADDVVFTYHLIQNPDAHSPLANSWQNIKIAATDARTVTFTLPGALSSFPHSLTTGLVPQHILKDVAAGSLRSDPFNTTTPIGAGPFRLNAVQVSGDTPTNRQEQISLVPFDKYHAGRPKLDQFVVHAFRSQDEMLASYETHDLTAIAGGSVVPTDDRAVKGQEVNNMITAAANMVFFKTSQGVLADKAVRQALVTAADPAAIIKQLGYQTPLVNQPFLQGQVSSESGLTQQTGNLAKAKAALDAAGWTEGKGGVRSKDKTKLAFSLYAQDTPEDRVVVEALRRQWQAAGANVSIELQDAPTLQDTITFHNYDALLYGITIGRDPDVFPYWHSSQADVRSANRLNFSEYKSSTADAALEAGRARTDASVRSVKYKPFLQAWLDDAPALGLYQPRYIYVSNTHIEGLMPHELVSPVDHYSNVHNWMIRQARVTHQ